MSLDKSYAVFGLGRYGQAVAKELAKSGADVLAVDRDNAKVEALVGDVALCKCADITDAQVLQQLDIGNIDVVIIAVASDLATAVMATTLCKEAGTNTVIAKCADEMQQKILKRVGADVVVIPEREAGTHLAKNLLSSGFVDLVELTQDVSMVEISVRPEWVGRSLMELDLRQKYAMNVVALRQKGEVSVTVDPFLPLSDDMSLVVIANTAKLQKLK